MYVAVGFPFFANPHPSEPDSRTVSHSSKVQLIVSFMASKVDYGWQRDHTAARCSSCQKRLSNSGAGAIEYLPG